MGKEKNAPGREFGMFLRVSLFGCVLSGDNLLKSNEL
jgi:hypothetical protein